MRNDDLPEKGSAASNYYYSRSTQTNHIGSWFETDGPVDEQTATHLRLAITTRTRFGDYTCRSETVESEYGWSKTYTCITGPKRKLMLTKRKELEFESHLERVMLDGTYRKVPRPWRSLLDLSREAKEAKAAKEAKEGS